MITVLLRVWLPDRPGALGQVASRIGAVRGSVVGIDIIERDGGRAVDELVVELDDPGHLGLLVAEVNEVDGVDVEDVVPLVDGVRDPRLEALDVAATLVSCRDRAGLLDAIVDRVRDLVSADWSAVVDLDERGIVAADGAAPGSGWLLAFVAGAMAAGGDRPAATDITWSPLGGSGLALVVGRSGLPYRSRERRHVAALARLATTRFGELSDRTSRATHPSAGRSGEGAPGQVVSIAQPRLRSTARVHRS